MKKVDFNKLQAGDLVKVPRTQFAPMRSGWNGWLFSEAVVIRKGVGRKSKRNVVVPIQGGGGELGQHAVTGLVSLISGLKEMKTERELEQLLSMVYGWGACCKHCGFLTEKSTDDVMHMAEELAEIESKRIEKETGEAGKE